MLHFTLGLLWRSSHVFHDRCFRRCLRCSHGHKAVLGVQCHIDSKTCFQVTPPLLRICSSANLHPHGHKSAATVMHCRVVRQPDNTAGQHTLTCGHQNHPPNTLKYKAIKSVHSWQHLILCHSASRECAKSQQCCVDDLCSRIMPCTGTARRCGERNVQECLLGGQQSA